VWQGLAGIALFLALWQIGTWLRLPMLRHVPAPLDVLVQFATVVQSRQYWLSWYVSGQRVFLGYAIGIWRRYSDDRARAAFRYSILYLALLFAALMIDHYLPLLAV